MLTVTDETAGWDPIDARLEEFYPGVEPKHFGTLIEFAIGGVGFYRRPGQWHIVSHG